MRSCWAWQALAVVAVSALVVALSGCGTLTGRWPLNTLMHEVCCAPAVELELAPAVDGVRPANGPTAREAIDRIDRRSRKVAEQVGALDYDDEDAV
jgi:hypothetical protein